MKVLCDCYNICVDAKTCKHSKVHEKTTSGEYRDNCVRLCFSKDKNFKTLEGCCDDLKVRELRKQKINNFKKIKHG